MNKSYKNAGVDLGAGYKAVELIKSHAERTRRAEVLGGVGAFGGLFSLSGIKGMDDPVLVSGADGVGTKLALAFMMDKHDTVGIDCVAMCVNDIVCSGAAPLFFLDYIACGRINPEKIEQIVKGVADGCLQAGAALLGGETAEHPGLMPQDEYDLAGFAVGVAEKRDVIDGKNINEGDVLLGLASSGVHSNGFSLIRSILGIDKEKLAGYGDKLGMSLGETLLTPTKIYVKSILALQKAVGIKGIAHITGGGFYENVPRILPQGFAAKVRAGDLHTPPVFDIIGQAGKVTEQDMFATFNMGVGMVVCVAPSDEAKARNVLEAAGETVYNIGGVTAAVGDGGLWLE